MPEEGSCRHPGSMRRARLDPPEHSRHLPATIAKVGGHGGRNCRRQPDAYAQPTAKAQHSERAEALGARRRGAGESWLPCSFEKGPKAGTGNLAAMSLLWACRLHANRSMAARSNTAASSLHSHVQDSLQIAYQLRFCWQRPHGCTLQSMRAAWATSARSINSQFPSSGEHAVKDTSNSYVCTTEDSDDTNMHDADSTSCMK